jgi:anti-sigma factor RsiW
MEDKIRHVNDEQLEQYVLGDLPEEQLAELEQHLLICGPCQERLARMDAYVASMEAAARRMRQEQKADTGEPARRAGRESS